MRRRGFGTVLFALVFGMNASAMDTVPLPDDLSIATPGPDVSAAYARWSGYWRGRWDGKLPHTLVVESIDATGRVVAVYAVGQYYGWGVSRRFRRYQGQLSDDGASLALEPFYDGTEVTYTYLGKQIEGRYRGPNRVTGGRFVGQADGRP